MLAHFPGEALAGDRLRAALRLHHRLRPARPHGAARRLRLHRGGHRPRPHRDRLRRGRLPARRAVRDHPPEPGHAWRGPSTSGSPTSRAAFVKEADPDIVKALEEKGRLLRAETYLHAYPALLALRHAAALLRQVELVRRAPARSATGMLAANEEIGWHPEHIKHGRFGKWLEGNVDWALSRDRYWGTPLPIWECDGRGLRAALLRRLDRGPPPTAAARSPTTSTAPTSTRSCCACDRRGLRGRRCAGSRR